MCQALKDDKHKLRYDLVPPVELEGMVKVLTFGSIKYGPNNWQEADKAFVDRVLAANMRHEAEIRKGNLIDEESGELHAYHMMCNSMFLAWYSNNKPSLLKDSPTSKYAGSSATDHEHTRIVSWDQLDGWITNLSTLIKQQFEENTFECIVYVPRGGRVPGEELGKKLKLPVYSIKEAYWKENYTSVLVIDDINDTGETLWRLMEEAPDGINLTFATVVKRHDSVCSFAWFGHLENSNDYLIFPWEGVNDHS